MRKKQILPLLGILGVVLAMWLGIKFALPAVLPFLMGAIIALSAEPLVGLLHRKCKLPRWAATGLGVAAVLLAISVLTLLLAAVVVRQAGNLTRVIPDLADSAQQSITSLRLWLSDMAADAPESLRPILLRSAENLFSGSGAAMEKVTDKALNLASGFLSRLPGNVLGISTGILAAFMISTRLSGLKAAAGAAVSPEFRKKYLPALKDLRSSVLGWLLAQLKLSAVTATILVVGFWALQIPYGPVWGLLVAFIDALPVLGTGAVLIPWSIICFLQGQTLRGIGLLGIYAVAWLARSVLEPKLIGRQLGLDPLLTLIAMYAGFRFFGLAGMIGAPLAAVCIVKTAGIFRQPQEN